MSEREKLPSIHYDGGLIAENYLNDFILTCYSYDDEQFWMELLKQLNGNGYIPSVEAAVLNLVNALREECEGTDG